MAEDKVNILIVDDLPEKLLAMQVMLEDLGENLVTARSGCDALRCLLDQDFAVILLDVNMPDMDGFETASLIRQRKKLAHTPIIFITAYADEIHTARGYSLGAVDYILAPIVPEILRSKVKVFVQLFNLTQQIRRQADERIALAREQAARAIAEESMRRANFLAEASKVMSGSLDIDDVLNGVTRLVTPFLADMSLLMLIDENETAYRSQLTWVSESGVQTAIIGALHDRVMTQAMEQVIASGHMELLTDLKPADTELQIAAFANGVEETIEIGFACRH